MPASVAGNFNAGLPAVVEGVYDCIADSERWADALTSIYRSVDGCLATLGVVDTASNAARLLIYAGDPAVVGPLMNDYAAENPLYSAVPRMEIDTPFTIDDIYELQGPAARQTWLDSRIAREWVVPNRLDDFFWVALMKQPARVGTLIVLTDKDRPQITQEDRDRVALIAPHVRRAVTIGDLFEVERRTADIFRTIVESLSYPVLVVSQDMRVLFANPAAEALLSEGVAATSHRGQLTFSFPQANAALTRAVELGTRDEFALGPAGISVPLMQAKAPAVAHVLPLARRDPSARIRQQAAAAIFVAAAGAGPMPALDAIAALFALTAAEKRVAGQIAAGHTRGEIAESAGVSDGTVKSQLAAIYDKTGTSDQRELQLLVRELSPPIASS